MISAADAGKLLADSAFTFSKQVVPEPSVDQRFPEVQVALTAARTSCAGALTTARVMNTLSKAAEGKELKGKYTAESQDALRAALIFAGAGLDTSLKRLIVHALPQLVASEKAVADRLARYAETRLKGKDGHVDAGEIVHLFLSTGQSPRDILVQGWVRELTDGSAQSTERVRELSVALGYEDKKFLKRVQGTGDTPSLLALPS